MPNLMRRNEGAPAKGRSIFTDFFSDVDRFFDNDLFLMPMHLKRQMEGNIPAVNIRDNEKEYVIEVAAPGMKKDDFNIDMEEGQLTISSQREDEKTEERENYRRREYNFSSFSRTLTLPENVEADKIKAYYENGILRLNIPKTKEQERPKRKIKID